MTRRVDLWFSVLLTALGLAAMFESWRMPRLQELGVHPMSAPGLTPGLLGVVLAGLGLALLARSLTSVRQPLALEGGWGRFAAALVLCVTYAAGLLGRLPFWLATALFVFAFVVTFADRRRPLGVRLAVGAALALAVAASVSLLFAGIFLVRLP